MEEHSKLVAKIQHFYDLLIHRIEDAESNHFQQANTHHKHDIEELRKLALEYTHVFENFLYREG